MTLTELLRQGQANYAVYDLGRKLKRISHAEFAAMEAQQMPYPYPIQGQARLAVVFWQAQAEPFMWFLKLPLDERGLVENSMRDAFCRNVVALLGQQLTGALSQHQQQELQSSPALYTPPQDKLAALNARIKYDLSLPVSLHFERAQSYLQTPDSEWQDVAVQGLHDVVANLNRDPRTTEALVSHLATPEILPVAVWRIVSEACALQNTPFELQQAWFQSLNIKNKISEWRITVLQALAAVDPTSNVGMQLSTWLRQKCDANNLNQIELTLIIGRLEQLLSHDSGDLLEAWLLTSSEQSQAFFNALFYDAVTLPILRPKVLTLMQRNDLPQPLFRAIQRLTQPNAG